MARDFARGFYDSPEWRKCRKAFIDQRISIDGGLCQECKDALGHIVHHTIPLAPDNIGNPEITLNHDLLEFVCLICHNRIDADDEDERYTFDETGQLVPLPPIRDGDTLKK